jgi:hypothetical protein
MDEPINKTLILEKITNNGLYLKHLSFELQNKYEIVMKAVKNDGSSLKYASK